LKGLVRQDEHGAYRLTSEGLRVYSLLKNGLPPEVSKEVSPLPENSPLFLPRLFYVLSVDSSLIVSFLLLALYVYVAVSTGLAILPFYVFSSIYHYHITILSFFISVGIITLYLKFLKLFDLERFIRLIFALAVSYLPMLLPIILVVYQMHTIKLLFYIVTFISQLMGLIIFTSGVLTITNQSVSKSIILPLAVHYINSVINYLTLL